MAGLWCLHCHRRKNGDCHFADTDVVHVYFLPDPWFPYNYLHGAGILGKYQTLHSRRQKKSFALLVSPCPPEGATEVKENFGVQLFFYFSFSFCDQQRNVYLTFVASHLPHPANRGGCAFFSLLNNGTKETGKAQRFTEARLGSKKDGTQMTKGKIKIT